VLPFVMYSMENNSFYIFMRICIVLPFSSQGNHFFFSFFFFFFFFFFPRPPPLQYETTNFLSDERARTHFFSSWNLDWGFWAVLFFFPSWVFSETHCDHSPSVSVAGPPLAAAGHRHFFSPLLLTISPLRSGFLGWLPSYSKTSAPTVVRGT